MRGGSALCRARAACWGLLAAPSAPTAAAAAGTHLSCLWWRSFAAATAAPAAATAAPAAATAAPAAATAAPAAATVVQPAAAADAARADSGAAASCAPVPVDASLESLIDEAVEKLSLNIPIKTESLAAGTVGDTEALERQLDLNLDMMLAARRLAQRDGLEGAEYVGLTVSEALQKALDSHEGH